MSAISILSRIGRFPIHSLINECLLDCKAISLYTLLYKHVGRSEAVSDVFCAIRDTEAHVVSSFFLFCSVFFLVLSKFSSVALPEVDLKVRIDNSAFDVCLRWPWRSRVINP